MILDQIKAMLKRSALANWRERLREVEREIAYKHEERQEILEHIKALEGE